MTRQSECPRHDDPLRPGNLLPSRYTVARCDHLGDRFVVQSDYCKSPLTWVDYVEDLPDGTVLVESRALVYAAEIAAVWDAFVAKMLAGIPPTPKS